MTPLPSIMRRLECIYMNSFTDEVVDDDEAILVFVIVTLFPVPSRAVRRRMVKYEKSENRVQTSIGTRMLKGDTI